MILLKGQSLFRHCAHYIRLSVTFLPGLVLTKRNCMGEL
uniref:Uncharacterized protein n=1 Tax=Arundo donax TaxID=35708 RepID=A0A0A9HM46_ARUDO